MLIITVSPTAARSSGEPAEPFRFVQAAEENLRAANAANGNTGSQDDANNLATLPDLGQTSASVSTMPAPNEFQLQDLIQDRGNALNINLNFLI